MTAPMQPDPLDAPDWLNKLLHPYCANSPLVAAVVWAAITERVGVLFDRAADELWEAVFKTDVLHALGADDD